MISSFVELPEFATPGTVITARRPLRDAWFKCGFPVMVGRDIAVTGLIHKYKVQYTDHRKGKTYSIVYLSQDKLDPYNLEDNKVIVPIYFREYNIRPEVAPILSNLVLWLPGINFVFKNWMGLGSVISIPTFSDRIIQTSSIDDPTAYIPRKLLDRMYDENFATASSVNVDDLFDALSGSYDMMQSKLMLDDILDKGAKLKGQVSEELYKILSIMNTSYMKKIMDPNHCLSQVTSQVMNSSCIFEGMNEMIHKYDFQIPKYVRMCDPIEEMELLLWYSSMAATSDFKLTCKGDINWDASFVDLSYGHPAKEVHYSVGCMIGDAIRTALYHQYGKSMDVDAVGSYLEDIWIYDLAGELVGYIDLVWWILAAAPGLINEEIVS